MDREALREQFRAAGLERVIEPLLALACDCISLSGTPMADEDIPLGASKLGGTPDLPIMTAWPERLGRPYSFIAQINFAEAKPYDPTGLLPEQGLHSLFFDLFGDEWLADRSLVLYSESPVTALRRLPTPQALLTAPASESYLEAFHFPSARVQFTADVAPLSPFSERLGAVGFVAEEEHAYYEVLQVPWTQKPPTHRMLGNAEGIQYDWGDEAEESQLLLQLDTDLSVGWMWGDVGFIGLWVPIEDLRRRDFSHVHLDFQCS